MPTTSRRAKERRIIKRVLGHALISAGKNIVCANFTSQSKGATHAEVTITFKYPIRPSKDKTTKEDTHIRVRLKTPPDPWYY